MAAVAIGLPDTTVEQMDEVSTITPPHCVWVAGTAMTPTGTPSYSLKYNNPATH